MIGELAEFNNQFLNVLDETISERYKNGAIIIAELG